MPFHRQQLNETSMARDQEIQPKDHGLGVESLAILSAREDVSEERHCLAVFDVKNFWSVPVHLRFQIRHELDKKHENRLMMALDPKDPGLDDTSKQIWTEFSVIHPQETKRLAVPVPRFDLTDDFAEFMTSWLASSSSEGHGKHIFTLPNQPNDIIRDLPAIPVRTDRQFTVSASLDKATSGGRLNYLSLVNSFASIIRKRPVGLEVKDILSSDSHPWLYKTVSTATSDTSNDLYRLYQYNWHEPIPIPKRLMGLIPFDTAKIESEIREWQGKVLDAWLVAKAGEEQERWDRMLFWYKDQFFRHFGILNTEWKVDPLSSMFGDVPRAGRIDLRSKLHLSPSM